MFDLLTLHRVADAAEHVAANIVKSADKMPDVDMPTMAAIAGAFGGFAIVLRAMDLGEIDLATMDDNLKQRIMEKVTPDNTTDRT